MKVYFLSILLMVGLPLNGQTYTSRIFNNLPLDRSVEEINQILNNDTSNYKIDVKLPTSDYSHYLLKQNSFFNLSFQKSLIVANHFRPTIDSPFVSVLFRYVYISRKNNSSKRVMEAYQEIVNNSKKEYDYSKSERFKYFRRGEQQTKVVKRITYFYSKKNDEKYKFSVTWCDEGKYGHEFIIEYNLD